MLTGVWIWFSHLKAVVLKTNILICIILQSGINLRKHIITYTFVHKHYIFLIKNVQVGIVLVKGLKFFLMNLALLENHGAKCNYIHTGEVGIQEV